MKKQFTEEQKKRLNLNPNVQRITNVGIIYTQEFRKKAIQFYSQGQAANDIFIEAGFNIDDLGFENPVKNLSKWRCNLGIKSQKNILSKKNDASKKQLIELKKALARIEYLEAENEFLKKLEALENQYR
jgi:transposase